MRDLPDGLAPLVRRLWAAGTPGIPLPLAAAPVNPTLSERCLGFTGGRQRLLAQHSSTTCGPNALAMFRVLTDDSFAAEAAARVDSGLWGQLENRLQQVTNSLASGLPWPRALGTLPWALAGQLERLDARRWAVHRVDHAVPAQIALALDAAGAWCAAGTPVPAYVGNDRLPRHVVLILAVRDGQVTLYDPALGGISRHDREGLQRGQSPVAGWRLLWGILTPTA